MAERGRFLGTIPDTHPYADPFREPLEALHPNNFKGMTPDEFMATRPGEEGFMFPGSELLWITKPDQSKAGESVPMSYLDPEVQNG